MIVLIALVVSALLNAQGIRKSVQTQPDGWKRDVGMALTRPLVGVSHALYLRPAPPGAQGGPRPRRRRPDRRGGGTRLLSGRGRSRSAEARDGALPVAPEKAKFSPERKLRVWVAGDSLSLVPGYAILRVVGRSEAMRAVAPVDGRLATGFERPDVFNWFKYIPNSLESWIRGRRPRLRRERRPRLRHGRPAGRVIEGFGSVSWIAEYRRRVAGIMDEVTLGGRFLVWIGVPITRDPDKSSASPSSTTSTEPRP